ncbi:hypothetical protein Ate01nite_30130 [Actinoplanes teichomyceticus]|nr:hypothetical protein Ate01nite_30130 [Actinoplanes teichomyceticus]
MGRSLVTFTSYQKGRRRRGEKAGGVPERCCYLAFCREARASGAADARRSPCPGPSGARAPDRPEPVPRTVRGAAHAGASGQDGEPVPETGRSAV